VLTQFIQADLHLRGYRVARLALGLRRAFGRWRLAGRFGWQRAFGRSGGGPQLELAMPGALDQRGQVGRGLADTTGPAAGSGLVQHRLTLRRWEAEQGLADLPPCVAGELQGVQSLGA
jgi:hypothetical protein